MASSLSNLPKRHLPLSLRTTPSPNPAQIQALDYLWKSSVPGTLRQVSKKSSVQLPGQIYTSRNTQEFLYEKQQYIRTIRKSIDPTSLRFSVSTLRPVLRKRESEVETKRENHSSGRRSWNSLTTRTPMLRAAVTRKPRKIDMEMQGKVEIAATQNEFGGPVITFRRRKSGLLTKGNFTLLKPSRSEGAEQSPNTVARRVEKAGRQRKTKVSGSNENSPLREDLHPYTTDRALPGWKLGSNHRRKATFPERLPLDSASVLQIHRFQWLPNRE